MRLIGSMKNLAWVRFFGVFALLLLLLPASVFAGLYSTTNVASTGTATASSYLSGWDVSHLNDGIWTADETGTWIAADGDYDAWVNIALASPEKLAGIGFQTPISNRALAVCTLSAKTMGTTEYAPIVWWVNTTTAVNGVSFDPIADVTDLKISFSNMPQEYQSPIAVNEIAIYTASAFDTIEVGGAMQSGATEGEVNLALAGIGISQDNLTPDYAQDRLNDGAAYDDANAWIAASLEPSWAGIILAEAADIDRIALGNRSGYPNRSMGTYVFEYTTADMTGMDPTNVAAIDALTWLQIGNDLRTDDVILARQLLQFDKVEDVTAIRVKIDGESYEVALAEIEVYASQGTSWIPGDANKDGKVDGSDVTILAGNWQMLTGATWAMGDFNADGKVDGSDVTILAGNWQAGTSTAASAVPEPGTVVLLLSLALGVLGLSSSRKGIKSMFNKIRFLSVLALMLVVLTGSFASAQLVDRELCGGMYFYDPALNVAPQGTAYASEERTDGYFVNNINDGIAGNRPDNVWCAFDWGQGTYIETPVPHLGKDYYAGVTLAAPTSINKVAWPIDPWYDGNRGTGFFELQYLTSGSSTWTTLSQHVDSVDFGARGWIEYEFPTIANVTDVRINAYVPNNKGGFAVQELMVFEDAASTAMPVQIAAQQDFNNPTDPNAWQDYTTNLAYWENGGVSFASSVLNTSYSVPSLNDGMHGGEANSFIVSTAETYSETSTGFCGIALTGASTIDRIAFGSQLGYNWRSEGIYTLQYTTDSLASAADELAVMAGPIGNITEQAIAEAGVAMDAMNWETITSFAYDEGASGILPRTVFQFDAISDVTAIRVVMTAGTGEMSIVELEVYAPDMPTAAASVPEPSTLVMLGMLFAVAGYGWFRRR